MNILVPITLFGWIPLVLVLFAVLPARRAAIAAFLLAWLFLPVWEYKIAGLPAYNKMTAACLGILLGMLVFDIERLMAFRPSLLDVPMLIWCICPFVSSLSNGLGAYDGLSAAFYQTVIWGLPYFVGRLYFGDRVALRELAIGIVIGGLIYVPLCLYEIRFSPQLHRIVYGYLQSSWLDTKRLGGWRPIVFMQHGLMLGMWMTTTAAVAVWLWSTGSLRRLWGLSASSVALILTATAILCRSSGALAILGIGLAALFLTRWLRLPVPILCLLLAAPLYMGLRGSGRWDGQNLISLTRTFTDEERAQSIQTRITNEDRLVAKALERPAFGWGGWGRFRVYSEEGRDISLTDGMWVIALGKYGLLGLASLTVAMLLPLTRVWRRIPAKSWAHPAAAPVVACAVLLAMSMLDNLMNAMINPIFMVAAGALSSPAILRATRRRDQSMPTARQPAAFADSGVVAAAGRGSPLH